MKCSKCNSDMKFISRLGMGKCINQLETYGCTSCGETEHIEVDPEWSKEKCKKIKERHASK